MREDDRRLCKTQHITHSLMRHMRQVKQHTQPIHLLNISLTELGQSRIRIRTPSRDSRRRSRPSIVTVVRSGDIANTKLVSLTKRGDGTAKLMTAFDAEHARDFAGLEGWSDAGGCVAVLEYVWVFGDEALCDVDLFQSVSDDPLVIVLVFEGYFERSDSQKDPQSDFGSHRSERRHSRTDHPSYHSSSSGYPYDPTTSA